VFCFVLCKVAAPWGSRRLDCCGFEIHRLWFRSISFRNQIVHGYATVRDDMVWEIVQVYLPRLRSEVEELLAEPEIQS